MPDLQIDNEALAAVTRVTAGSAEDLRGAEDLLRRDVDDAIAGAGEFAGALQEGMLTFQLSWTASLRTFGESCLAVSGLATQTGASMGSADAAVAAAARGSGP